MWRLFYPKETLHAGQGVLFQRPALGKATVPVCVQKHAGQTNPKPIAKEGIVVAWSKGINRFASLCVSFKKSSTQVQSDITNLAATVASIQGSIDESIDTALASGLSDINAVIEQLQSQVDNIATGEDVDQINESISGVEDELQALLESNNFFTGNLIINSEATLTFAESLGDKVKIINGNVIIAAPSDLDATKLQAVVDRILTITGNLQVRAGNSTAPAVTFDNLVGVGNITIAQATGISFAQLLSASEVVLGNNYESKLNGEINFGALTQVTSFRTGEVATDYSVSGGATNAIIFSKSSGINLASLTFYSPRILTLEADKKSTLQLGALETKDATGTGRSYTLSINGASEFIGSDGLKLGQITLEEVTVVNLPAFEGTVNINGGVEKVTLGALKNSLTATSRDLVSVNITANAASKAINFTGASSLVDVTIDGKIKTVTLVDNGQLESVNITAALESLTINNTSIVEANLEHTNSNLAKSGSLVVTNNPDLVTLKADKVNGLQTLTITNNPDLESISFNDLVAVPTEGTTISVTIGGTNATKNGLTALDINQTDATNGNFNSGDSGIDTLKAYLTEAAKVSASTLSVYFDAAETYINGTGAQENNLTIADDADKLVVVSKTNAVGSFSKRSFVIRGNNNDSFAANFDPFSFSANNYQITFFANQTAAGTLNNISQEEITGFDVNGVTLTANANAAPEVRIFSNTPTATISIPANTATATVEDLKKVSIKINDGSKVLYEAIVYLSSVDLNFTPVSFSATQKTAERVLVVDDTTDVSTLLNQLALNFNSVYFGVSVDTSNGILNGIIVFPHDYSDAFTGKTVVYSQTLDDPNLDLYINNAGTTVDDKFYGTGVQITLTSKVEGESLSTIGNPINVQRVLESNSNIAGAGEVLVEFNDLDYNINELGASSTVTTNAGVTYTKDVNDSPSATNVGVNGSETAPVNRIAWL